MYISRTVFQNPILSERMLQKFITRIIVKQHVESRPFAVTVRFQFWGRGQEGDFHERNHNKKERKKIVMYE